MENPGMRIQLPESIRSATIAFLNWYHNDIHVHLPPDPPPHTPLPAQTTHAENGEFEYDWRPRNGRSRLTLAHIETGLVAMNAFDFNRLGQTDPARMAPPPSLLMRTWFDLCITLEWVTEDAIAQLGDQMDEQTAADVHQFGEPIYGAADGALPPPHEFGDASSPAERGKGI